MKKGKKGEGERPTRGLFIHHKMQNVDEDEERGLVFP
jgi:hypothetical protein